MPGVCRCPQDGPARARHPGSFPRRGQQRHSPAPDAGQWPAHREPVLTDTANGLCD